MFFLCFFLSVRFFFMSNGLFVDIVLSLICSSHHLLKDVFFQNMFLRFNFVHGLLLGSILIFLTGAVSLAPRFIFSPAVINVLKN